MSASNKIEFSYLNDNLMVLTIPPLTLSLVAVLVTADRKGRRRLFNCEGNDGFDDNVIPPSLPHVSKKLLAAAEGQCTCQENKNE
jgi:hypothetical protein